MWQETGSTLQKLAEAPSISTAVATLVLAGLSGVIGVLAGWLGAYVKVKGGNLATKEDFEQTRRQLAANTAAVEDIKSDIARRTTLDTELREAVRAFTVAVGGLVHAVCWLTWDCKERRRLDADMVRRYDEEMHQLAPQILGQLAVVAMLSPEIHGKLSPLTKECFELDAKVGEAVIAAEKNLESGLVQLRACHATGNTLEVRFRESVSNLFSGGVRP